ncbi:MAG: antitoxin [Alkalispirochaeta sp.]
MTTTTRVFNNGNSQAVRIPREYRLESSTVRIFRNEDGDLVLHPMPDEPVQREARLLDILNRFEDEDIAAFEEAHRDQGDIQERETL